MSWSPQYSCRCSGQALFWNGKSHTEHLIKDFYIDMMESGTTKVMAGIPPRTCFPT